MQHLFVELITAIKPSSVKFSTATNSVWLGGLKLLILSMRTFRKRKMWG